MNAVAQRVSATAGERSTARLVLDVFKLRIGFSIALTALAGAMLALPQGAEAAVRVTVVVLAVFLASAAAGAFNQYIEVDIDRRMVRTRGRPFVTGRLPHHPLWLALIAEFV